MNSNESLDPSENAVPMDIIDKIGGMDVFGHIIRYLQPWDKIGLRSVCKHFNKVDCIHTHRVEDYYDHFEKFWQCNFQRSVIQLYCRPVLDDISHMFDYNTLLKISIDDLSNSHDLIQSLKYLFLFQNEFAKSGLTVERFSGFSKIVRQLKGMYINNRGQQHANTLNKFMFDILTNYSRNDNSCFKLLFFHHCALGSDGMIKICHTILQSTVPFQLEILFVSNDETLNDECMETLFACIRRKLLHLKMLCFRNTGISDGTCRIIHSFYHRLSDRLCGCQCNEFEVGDDDECENEENDLLPTKLTDINLTYNKQITSDGIKLLNQLFFMDQNLEQQHYSNCFFNSLAIATTIALDDTDDIKLSSRFRLVC